MRVTSVSLSGARFMPKTIYLNSFYEQTSASRPRTQHQQLQGNKVRRLPTPFEISDGAYRPLGIAHIQRGSTFCTFRQHAHSLSRANRNGVYTTSTGLRLNDRMKAPDAITYSQSFFIWCFLINKTAFLMLAVVVLCYQNTSTIRQ